MNNDDGTILRSVSQTAPGKKIRVTLSDGRIDAVVSEIKEEAK